VLSVLGLEAVVIGGGVAEAGDILLEPIRETIRHHQFMIAEHLHELKILRAELDEPGVMGAAVWAAEQWASMYPKHES